MSSNSCKCLNCIKLDIPVEVSNGQPEGKNISLFLDIDIFKHNLMKEIDKVVLFLVKDESTYHIPPWVSTE